MWSQATAEVRSGCLGKDREMDVPADWTSLYSKVVKSIPWLRDEFDNNETNPLVTMLRGSDRIRRDDADYRNYDLAQLDCDLAELQ